MKAVNGVTLSTDLAGIVREIAFVSGAAVKRGDVLVKLDTQQEEALLRLAEARLQFAKTDLTRKRDLQATKAISQSDWDMHMNTNLKGLFFLTQAVATQMKTQKQKKIATGMLLEKQLVTLNFV